MSRSTDSSATTTLANSVRSAFFRHSAPSDAEAGSAVVRQHLDVAARYGPDDGCSVQYVAPTDGPAALLVVTDDMPLLVDAVTAVVESSGGVVSRVLHPIVHVTRTDEGAVADVSATGGDVGGGESWMRVEFTARTAHVDPDRLIGAVARTIRILASIDADRAAVLTMQATVAAQLESRSDAADAAEGADLLRWLGAGNFTPLGYGYVAATRGNADTLGLCRTVTTDRKPLVPQRTQIAVVEGPRFPEVDRGMWLHTVVVSDFRDGSVVGEHRFVGLFTANALRANVLDIPVLARRVRDVLGRAGYRLDSHSGQALLEIVQDYPRPELFAIDPDVLLQTVVSVLQAAEREELLLFLRPHTQRGAVSALVYLPRDRYTTAVRVAMQDVLCRKFRGFTLAHTVRVSENPLALLHFTIRENPDAGEASHFDWDVVEDDLRRELGAASRSWDDDLRDLLGGEGRAHAQSAPRRMPESYKQDFDVSRAASDLDRIDALPEQGIDLQLYRRPTADHPDLRFTLYVAGERISLSEVLPILHSLGVDVIDERPYPITRLDTGTAARSAEAWIYDFGLQSHWDVTGESDDHGHAELAGRFCDTFAAVWAGAAEVDSFNTLVTRAGVTWPEAALLRAYAKYLKQVGFQYDPSRIADVLVQHAPVAHALVGLFGERFDPARSGDPEPARRELEDTIDGVSGLEADRILRAYLDLVGATLRTNYYRPADAGVPRSEALVLKFDPRSLSQLPQPRPRFEAFVYSPRVEGVHLRYGHVARGGLRWSDRLDDFRTEVLGLAKAQAVKNAVIVPVGAKGGFVVKRPPVPTGDADADRTAAHISGVECYREFIGALLDITDNIDLATGSVLAPVGVTRRDGDDPYLVVAADKGTATFSDDANAVAERYGFWLGDAFASGGSVGYDHKAMAITAKGAWASVERHFREMGIDPATQPFSVVGIGDMSGDVFGNGMLLSEQIRLIAAFDHRHVFLDPDPDARESHRERRRLFQAPRSSWDDYDRTLISDGGGVYARTDKSIPVSGPVRRALGLDDSVTRMSPHLLVSAILQAPVDLLWNGGIGTYVKAGSESHLDVGDKANDSVRIDAEQLRARVVVEGGNLGLTPRGRVEYARGGGRINTDALDNSAGVDCSDHEVNIKILLDSLVSAGSMDSAARHRMLFAMTGEVDQLVLAGNVAQNRLLGTSRADAAVRLPVHGRQIRALVAERGVDRDLEALPSDDEIAARAKKGTGLTSPELATLTAHVKLALKAELLNSELLDSAIFDARLLEYFPVHLRTTHPDAIVRHRLRREILATVVTNEVIDIGGVSYVFRLAEDLGVGGVDAVRAFAAASAIVDLPALLHRVEKASPDTAVSNAMIAEVRRLLDRLSRWMLNHRPQPLAIGAEIARYRDEVQSLLPRVPQWLAGPDRDIVERRAAKLVELGADVEEARAVVAVLHGFCALDIVDIADVEGRAVAEVAELYYALNAHLGVDHVLTAVSELDDTERWNALARLALRDDVYSSMRLLTMDVLSGSSTAETPMQKIADWETANATRLVRSRSILSQIFSGEPTDVATLSVAARQLRSMVGRSRRDMPIG